MKWAHTLVACVAIAFAACTSAESESYRVDDSGDGLTLVRTVPVSEASRLSLEPLWETSPEAWGDPSSVSMDSDHIAVVDPQTVRIHLFDASSGEGVSSFGQRGEGPDEWREVSDAVLVDELVVVSTRSTVGLALHTRSGEARGTIDFEMLSPQIAGGPDGVVLATSQVQQGVVLIAGGTAVTLSPDSARSTYDEAEYGPCVRRAPTRRGFARLQCSAGRMEFYDRAGTLLGRTEWSQDPREATDEALDAYLDRFWSARSGGRQRSAIIDRQLEGVAERARITPRFSHLRSNRADGSFLLVEQPFDGFGGEPATLHRLDADGRHLGIVQTDLFVRDAAMHGDQVALLVTDPGTGLVRLVVARIR